MIKTPVTVQDFILSVYGFIFLGLVGYGTQSIRELNEKMAVTITILTNHKERLDKQSEKIDDLYKNKKDK